MNCIIQKYSTSILLAFVMLLVVSCQKGGEPIPNFESNDTVSQASEITADQRLGDGDDGNDEEYAPESGGDDDDDGGNGGNGNVVVGGDDNEDDDDNGITVGGSGGSGGSGDDGDDDDTDDLIGDDPVTGDGGN